MCADSVGSGDRRRRLCTLRRLCARRRRPRTVEGARTAAAPDSGGGAHGGGPARWAGGRRRLSDVRRLRRFGVSAAEVVHIAEVMRTAAAPDSGGSARQRRPHGGRAAVADSVMCADSVGSGDRWLRLCRSRRLCARRRRPRTVEAPHGGGPARRARGRRRFSDVRRLRRFGVSAAEVVHIAEVMRRAGPHAAGAAAPRASGPHAAGAAAPRGRTPRARGGASGPHAAGARPPRRAGLVPSGAS
ncbi:hypothetical protein QE392_002048 [Microbacterium proteolyticum]|nr:hypothetical protein [Microbacterium sp. SORGH_AS_0344]MDQ1170244.1 hypothetical protein [Microbacterium proteolyticum]